ncbi:MAG: entericidin A/B family lipoprotein [Opitutales bacterium]|nr:entericidin A/B family lipoprotein [Opitutales bacterium]
MKNTKCRSITLRSLLVTLTLIGALVASGCNTMEGVGKDTEAAGEAIQESAR